MNILKDDTILSIHIPYFMKLETGKLEKIHRIYYCKKYHSLKSIKTKNGNFTNFCDKNARKLSISASGHFTNNSFRYILHKLKTQSRPNLFSVEIDIDEEHPKYNYSLKPIYMLLRLRPKSFRITVANTLNWLKEDKTRLKNLMKKFQRATWIQRFGIVLQNSKADLDVNEKEFINIKTWMPQLISLELDLGQSPIDEKASSFISKFSSFTTFTGLLDCSLKILSLTFHEPGVDSELLQKLRSKENLTSLSLKYVLHVKGSLQKITQQTKNLGQLASEWTEGHLKRVIPVMSELSGLKHLNFFIEIDLPIDTYYFLLMWDLMSSLNKLVTINLEFVRKIKTANYYQDEFPKRKLSYNIPTISLPKDLRKLSLNLSSNILLMEKDFASITRCLSQQRGLQELSLNLDKSLASAENSFNNLAELFYQMDELRSLDLNLEGARLKKNKKKKFLGSLGNLKNLRMLKLNLSFSSIKDDHMFILGSSLCALRNLNRLSLILNHCSKITAKGLAMFFQTQLQKIETLNRFCFQWKTSKSDKIQDMYYQFIIKSLKMMMNRRNLYLLHLDFGNFADFSNHIPQEYKTKDPNKVFIM